MSDFIPIQASIFVATILSGIGMGVIYDSIRIIRRIIPHSNLVIAIEDLIYWICCSVLLFNILYSKNNGVIRGFSIIGVMIGLCSYYIIISKLYVSVAVWIINKIKKLMGLIFGWITAPLRWIYYFIIKITIKPKEFVIKELKKPVNQVKIRLEQKKALKIIAYSEIEENKHGGKSKPSKTNNKKTSKNSKKENASKNSRREKVSMKSKKEKSNRNQNKR